MTRTSFKFAIVATLALSPLLGGCAAAVVGGVAAAGGAGYEAAQERGINGTFDDMQVQTKISSALNSQYGNISTTVYAGQVLLTGSAPTPQGRFQAEQVARQTPGVKVVYNEIQVGPNPDGMQIAQDDWISARVRSDLVFNADIRSGNYAIETDRGSVYLMGSARSQGELDRATQLARYVPGVQRVVSYVTVRYGEPTTAQASPPPMNYGGGYNGGANPSYGTNQSYVPPSGPPPANAQIQVQKLN